MYMFFRVSDLFTPKFGDSLTPPAGVGSPSLSSTADKVSDLVDCAIASHSWIPKERGTMNQSCWAAHDRSSGRQWPYRSDSDVTVMSATLQETLHTSHCYYGNYPLLLFRTLIKVVWSYNS